MGKALKSPYIVVPTAFLRRWWLTAIFTVLAWAIHNKIEAIRAARHSLEIRVNQLTLGPAVRAEFEAERNSLMWEMVLWYAGLVGVIAIGIAVIVLWDRRKNRQKAARKAAEESKVVSKDLHGALTDLADSAESSRQATAKRSLDADYGHLAAQCDCVDPGNAEPISWWATFRRDEPYGITVSARELLQADGTISVSTLKARLHAANAPHLWFAWTTGDDGIEVDTEEGTVTFRIPRKERKRNTR